MRSLFSFIFISLLCIQSLFALTSAQLSKGNKAYEEGKFADAIMYYEQIVAEEKLRSAALYFNLGNSYYKLTDYPNAILNYERALRMSPNEADIQYNLDLANGKIEDKIEPLPQLFYKRWYYSFRNAAGQDAWASLFLICFALSVLALGLFFLSSKSAYKKLGFYGCFAFLSAALVFISLAFSMRHWQDIQREAIVFAGSVSVKSSPVESGTGLFVIHSGTKVKITDELGAWRRVKLADGNEGWLQSGDIEEL